MWGEKIESYSSGWKQHVKEILGQWCSVSRKRGRICKDKCIGPGFSRKTTYCSQLWLDLY